MAVDKVWGKRGQERGLLGFMRRDRRRGQIFPICQDQRGRFSTSGQVGAGYLDGRPSPWVWQDCRDKIFLQDIDLHYKILLT